MKQRWITALIGIPIFIAVTLSPLPVFVVVVNLLMVVAFLEMFAGIQKSEKQVPLLLQILFFLYPLLLAGLYIIRIPTSRFLVSGFPPAADRIFLLTVFSVWATDSFAFFAGHAFGKTKLAPTISPNKTVEGAIGGAVAGTLFGTLFGYLMLHNTGSGAIIGAIAAIFGQAGDLLESAIKRRLGTKDFGRLLPGHGGVLDRFDSLMVVTVLVAIYIRL
ncbi:MAG: phosphatidate cytidylyltransferase [Chthonomonadales bacterium]